MSLFPPAPFSPYTVPPSIGPTGLGGLTGASLNGTLLPYASGVGGLMSGPAGAGTALPRIGPQSVESLRPLATSLAPQAAETRLATQLAGAVGGGGVRGALGSAVSSLGLSRPGLGKATVYGIGSQIGGHLADQLNVGGANSIADQFATGAVAGGIGGGAFGGVGALIGAPVGGALNVLGNALGLWGNSDSDTPDAEPLEVLAAAMQSANLPPDQEEAILQTYETQMALAGALEGDAREQAEAAVLESTGQMILAAMQRNQQQAQMSQSNGTNMLALQAQAADIFAPIAQDIETNAGLYAQAMQQIRPNLPSGYQAVSDATVARELTSADKLANAYRAQAALTPVVGALTQYQQDQNAFASQLFQQMQAQQAAAMAGGGYAGGGATDPLTALLPTG